MHVSPRAFLLDAPLLTAERLHAIRSDGLGVYTPDSTKGTMLDTVRMIVEATDRSS